MVRKLIFVVFPFLFGLLILAQPTSAIAETLTWKIRSEYKYSVSLEFYARDRSHVWPGGGKVYVLRDADTHTYTLSCDSGEWICFGAWSRGNPSRYWGVGKGGHYGCEGCCYQCNGGTTDLRILTPHSPSALQDKNRRY